MGAPVSPEFQSGRGRGQEFTDGKSIYWSRHTGAFELHGLIAKLYRELGGGSSHLGLPVSDEEDYGVGRRNRFEHGEITWVHGDPVAHVHYTA